jgi:transposase
LLLLLTSGQTSDYKGARYLLERLPGAKDLLADRGYDADWFRNALKEMGISACIPPTSMQLCFVLRQENHFGNRSMPDTSVHRSVPVLVDF